jgi:hypothetical protein
MSNVLVILQSALSFSQREAVMRIATPTQIISDRVFIANIAPAQVAQLQAMQLQPTTGVALVLVSDQIAAAPSPALPALDPTELLFVKAWLTSLQPKKRVADGLAWDTPPMLPPDKKM